MPWHPPACTCGHPDSSHHLTAAGRLTYCCAGSQAGNCPCERFEEAAPGRFGPLDLALGPA
jgi:hypothetical protein